MNLPSYLPNELVYLHLSGLNNKSSFPSYSLMGVLFLRAPLPLMSGMAVARDLKGKKERIVTVISNWSTMAGQVYEGMSNAGYLDSNMVVILNDSRHSLHPNPDEGQKMTVSSLSSIISKIQSSKYFRRFREVAKVCCSLFDPLLIS